MKARVEAFLVRLSGLVSGDTDAPEVLIATDEVLKLNEDGTCHSDGTGAEAILIVRGSQEGREMALRKLLAQLP